MARKITSKKSKIISNDYFIAALLFAMAFILYGNTLNHKYALDDFDLMNSSPYVYMGTQIFPQYFNVPEKSAFNDNTKDAMIIRFFYSRPITVLTFNIEFMLFGEHCSEVQHFVNVFLFALTCSLLYLAFLKVFQDKRFFVFLAILFFLFHPIHTEVVANIKSRDEILALLLGLALPLFLIFNSEQGKKYFLIAIAALSFLLGLLSKQNAITFMAIFPLFMFYTKWQSKDIIRTSIFFLIPVIIYLFILDSTSGIITQAAFDFNQNILFEAGDFQSRYATPIYVLLRYLSLLFFPYPLAWDYSFSENELQSFGNPLVLLSLLIHLALLVFAALKLKKRTIISLAILFYFITISINSNIFIITESIQGERFLYTPSLGFVIAVAFILINLFKFDLVNFPELRKSILSSSILLILIGFMAIQTISRNNDWKDQGTIITRDIEKNPNAILMNRACAMYFLGLSEKEPNQMLKRRHLEESIRYFKHAGEIYPKNVAWNKLGTIYLKNRDFKNAEVYFLKSVEHLDSDRDSRRNLGRIYAIIGDNNKAIEQFNLFKELHEGYLDDSLSIFKLDKHLADKEFINQARNSIRQNPLNPKKYFDLAFYFQNTMNDLDSAIYYFNKVLELDSNYYKTYEMLGYAYTREKQYINALEAFNKAYLLTGNKVGYFQKIADTHIYLNNMDSAIVYYRRIFYDNE
jgi:protein O-mannosyl-transferase